jgi:hypothetical protein
VPTQPAIKPKGLDLQALGDLNQGEECRGHAPTPRCLLRSPDADIEPSGNARGVSRQTKSTSTYSRYLKTLLNSDNPFGRSPDGVTITLSACDYRASTPIEHGSRQAASIFGNRPGGRQCTVDAMRVREIRFSNPEIPFEAASLLLSYIAYPSDTDEQTEFSRALCRWEHRAATLRNPEWRSSPKLVRPIIFFKAISTKTIQKQVDNLMLRIVTCVSMLLPQLHRIDEPDPPLFGNSPSVSKIARNISELSGKSKQSGADIISDVWAPAKPVAHLAYAYWDCVLDERLENDPEFATKSRCEMLTPLPDKEQLLRIISYAELIRQELLDLPGSRFEEDNMIKVIACGG